MKEIDRLYMKWPFHGSRRILNELRKTHEAINQKRVQRLMQVMGFQALVPGPPTSKPHPEHPIYPYLLGGIDVVRPDQAWATDITYIPLEHGWSYLVAIMDWFSRAILSWRVSNTMTVDFCIEALEEALRTLVGVEDVRRSVVLQRIRRSLKYEDIYLHDYATLAEARAGIDRWIRFYNLSRPHQALDNGTPMEVYRSLKVVRSAA